MVEPRTIVLVLVNLTSFVGDKPTVIMGRRKKKSVEVKTGKMKKVMTTKRSTRQNYNERSRKAHRSAETMFRAKRKRKCPGDSAGRLCRRFFLAISKVLLNYIKGERTIFRSSTMCEFSMYIIFYLFFCLNHSVIRLI